MSSFWHARSLTGIVDHKPPRTPYGKHAEDLFLSIPNEQSAIDASRKFATKPHMAGTDGDLQTARDFLTLLQTELGIHTPAEEPLFHAGSPESQHATRGIAKHYHPRAWIDQYFPVMNTPLDRSVRVLDEDGSVLWDADLVEHADDTDPEAGKYADAVPTFHGLSKGGDVTGHVIDGNYCTHEDYEKLEEKDVDFKDTIILCRYGAIFRGLKVKGAQDRGAAGVLIYSDPRDDGSITEENGYEPYPHGPARNPTSVQRGSVQFLSMYPGDPTTPGYPSYENSTRTEGLNIPTIPSLPISWANAQKLFKVLERGDLLEGKKVRLLNNVDTRVIPIWNTMGVIPGHIRNEVVVIGNHRDAWVMGAADPSSGTSSIHEVVRGLGHLVKKGWKPLRTIVIASWDAEEYGLIGSTEWGEDFADWIKESVVAYINLDGSVSGSKFSVRGSPLLAHLLRGIAEELPHPTDKGRTLWDASNDKGMFASSNFTIPEEVLAMREMEKSKTDDLGVGVLGSGSDYTIFLQRLGVASTDGGGFGGTPYDAAYHYHSVYDSERWMEVYADPGFFRHVAASKFVGIEALRISSSVILPYNTTHYAFELENYLDGVEDIADSASLSIQFDSLRSSLHSLQKASAGLDKEKVKAEKELHELIKKWKKRRSSIRRKLRKAYCRIKKALGKKCKCPHKRKESEGSTDITHVPRSEVIAHARLGRFPAWLQEQNFKEEGDIMYGIAVQAGFDGARHVFDFDFVHQQGPHFPIRKLRRVIKRIQAVNKKLTAFERGLISKEGIKDREWYKHLGVAPGKWLGYGATTLPALTEALTFDKNTTLAQQEADRLKSLIDRLAEEIKVN